MIWESSQIVMDELLVHGVPVPHLISAVLPTSIIRIISPLPRSSTVCDEMLAPGAIWHHSNQKLFWVISGNVPTFILNWDQSLFQVFDSHGSLQSYGSYASVSTWFCSFRTDIIDLTAHMPSVTQWCSANMATLIQSGKLYFENS